MEQMIKVQIEGKEYEYPAGTTYQTIGEVRRYYCKRRWITSMEKTESVYRFVIP